MKLKSFGCSFIFGADLSDDVKGTHSQLTWPALLSKNLNCEYECHARSGSGNLQILESILNQIDNSTVDDLFVIGWTWIDRFDYYSSDTKPYTHPWTTILPSEQSMIAKTYYKNLHSEYKDKFTSLTYINTAIDQLKQNNLRYVMTYIDRLLFDQRWHTTPAVRQLQRQVEPEMTLFNGQTFLEWSRANNYTESKLWHPLDDAHRDAVKLLDVKF